MWHLIIPSFFAGLLTFLAPCTLPLVPSYLGFISGVSLTKENLEQKIIKKKILLNSLLYVLGFSLIFIILGSLFALGGGALIGYRLILSRIGGIFIIIFGLFMLHFLKIPGFGFLNKTKKINLFNKLQPGKPLSSFIFGASFAFGWTPCIGPILGSVLFLASTTATLGSGIILLSIFSLGLALPFLLIALSIESALKYLPKINKILPYISTIGGIFLVIIGVLMLTDSFGLFISWFYKIFSFLNYDQLLNYL
ncbi:cytochrome c biogenesis protein CcdA [Candidatus Nomurabacteria bacterium]|nr:cytochrome c biogenesis protein CcdA [Candidatus Nomurabacteria bacterium]